MRRVDYAACFVTDADRITEYIETNFGVAHADAFIADSNHFCELVASQPRMSRKNHGYRTTLHGVAHDHNWLFLEFDDAEIRFVHMVEGVRHKPTIRF